jgi:hypothetical protein
MMRNFRLLSSEAEVVICVMPHKQHVCNEGWCRKLIYKYNQRAADAISAALGQEKFTAPMQKFMPDVRTPAIWRG